MTHGRDHHSVFGRKSNRPNDLVSRQPLTFIFLLTTPCSLEVATESAIAKDIAD